VLEISNIVKTYGEGETQVRALRDVCLIVPDGDFLAIVGHSGSGKSTLLNIIGGLDSATGGEIRWNGKRIDNLSEKDLVSVRRKEFAYVFQQYHLIPSLTALENVILPLTFAGANGVSHDIGLGLLAKVGLEKRAAHKPSQLSGGEQQRVAIARALANNASLILADEPTGNVDEHTGREIVDIFHALNKEGRTIVTVTHNLEVAREAKRIVTLKDGEIVNVQNCS
jgi:putative ABC transport system ATP-binding protein